MTERENYLLVMNGQKPEWIPNFEDAADMIIPAILLSHFMTEEKIDFFSVPWTLNDAGPMIDNHQKPVMEDVNDWKQFVHFPDVSEFPWEPTSQAQLAEHDPDKAIIIMPNFGGGTIFMPLMNMMGFENGLCALIEEPDVCREFFAYVTSFYEECIPYIVKYYHPDAIIVGDDLCTATRSFISMDTYKEILKPLYQREIDIIHKYGVKAELHMCGKCEPFVYDFADMGADSWEPAQGSNDIAAIQEKYGNKFVINGTWSTGGPAWQPGAPESLVRSELRNCMDKYGKNGGMIFWTGGQVGNTQDQIDRFNWVTDEARKYGRIIYNK